MNKNKLIGGIVGIQLVVLLVILVTISLGGCTDAPKVTDLLQSQGYTQVQTTGYSFFGCGENDLWRTGFIAKSPNGTNVEGVVCEGIFKGQTVRFD